MVSGLLGAALYSRLSNMVEHDMAGDELFFPRELNRYVQIVCIFCCGFILVVRYSGAGNATLLPRKQVNKWTGKVQ